ncbi:helix-turn-helix transcriptional regulator [Virgibacillus dokdonensis]|uniref:Helix-turn-helix transcriptional regulator n=2 Tax=Virgibacillus dokdonensis TaxID=302167 RepID=A0ABU7VIK4_9BACI
MAPSKIIRGIDKGTFLLKRDFSQESNWRADHCYKFIYSLDGMINYQTNRNQINFNHHQYILFNPQDEHKQLAVEGKKFLIELNPTFLNHVSKSVGFVVQNDIQFALNVQKSPQISNWVKFVLDYIVIEKNDPHAVELFLEHSFSQLALILLKNAVGTHTQDIHVNSYKIISPQIYATICALKESYPYSWNLDQMAEIANLNKYQFAHFFKEIIGISPYSWLQLYRIIRSQEMLIKTDKTTLQIAMDCGFSSITVYNQLFKRLYGITPEVFRERMNK